MLAFRLALGCGLAFAAGTLAAADSSSAANPATPAAAAGTVNAGPTAGASSPGSPTTVPSPAAPTPVPALSPPAAQAAPSTLGRPSLLPLAQPLWSDLKPAQRQVLAPFAEGWNALPLEEKRAWVALADKYPRLSQAEKDKAAGRIRDWAKLTPEQRKLARQNYRLAKSLPRDEREAQLAQYNTLTDEQKKVLQTSGSTSNTAAGHAGARTALAKEASQPLSASPAAVAPGLRLPGSARDPAHKP